MNATVTSILTRFGGAAFSFISLCCGGGILDYALLRTGRYRCVGAWDIDARAREVYKANHGHEPGGDFTDVPPADVPAPLPVRRYRRRLRRSPAWTGHAPRPVD